MDIDAPKVAAAAVRTARGAYVATNLAMAACATFGMTFA